MPRNKGLGFDLRTAQRVYDRSMFAVDDAGRIVVGVPDGERKRWLLQVDATDAIARAIDRWLMARVVTPEVEAQMLRLLQRAKEKGKKVEG